MPQLDQRIGSKNEESLLSGAGGQIYSKNLDPSREVTEQESSGNKLIRNAKELMTDDKLSPESWQQISSEGKLLP